MRYIFFFLSFISFAQQTTKVDFKTAKGNISVDVNQKKVFGIVSYVFEVKESIDTIKIDAQKMTFSDVKINKKSVKFSNSGKTLNLFEGFKKGKNTLTFYYEAFPKQTMYFVGHFDCAQCDKRDIGSEVSLRAQSRSSGQVWTQGQGKYTSHWFPSFDDVNEKVIFNMNVTFDENYNVIANGFLKNSYVKDSQKKWYYEMKKPMSSYLLALVIGDFYNKIIASKSGIPLQFFIQPKDTSKFEPTYRHSKQIFDYLEKEIGFNYPWKLYKQVPVEDFLYAGMENTTTTLFTTRYVVDDIAFTDRNYTNVDAHELAHHWFGDLITAESSTHHWLQEGFATYYALLAERHLFGDDYFYEELNDYAEQLKRASKTDTIPVMNEKASSLSFYKKGAWALHVMRENIGAKNFQKAVKKYLKKYQYKNVNTDDFLKIVKQVSGYDVENFKKVWLEKPGFEMEIAQKYLSKDKFIQDYFTLKKSKKSLAELTEILKSDAYYPIKQYIVYQTRNLVFEERKVILETALATNDILVRRAVAESTPIVPEAFKLQYETLLNDNSYQTKEIALSNLWKNFPDDRLRYLEQTKEIVGNNDKSFRLTWLALAMNTENLSEQVKATSYNQLLDFASENYESSVRQNALELLLQLNSNDEKVIELLFKATVHHKWQFTKFGRDNVRLLLKKPEYRTIVEKLASTSEEIMKELYWKFLNEK